MLWGLQCTKKRNLPMAKRGRPVEGKKSKQTKAESYRYPEAESPLRPEAGTQAQFRKKKPPATYHYDSSLSPALEWDGQNGARDLGEWLIACIRDAASLNPPHAFEKPRELVLNDGSLRATVRDLQDDTHKNVEAFVKNAGLGFAIPYLHNGQPHEYVPDFIIRLVGAPPVHLILETKGFDDLADIKAQAAQRWVNAVNADGSFGTWRYAMVRKLAEIPAALV
jgi:hypothetical protein